MQVIETPENLNVFYINAAYPQAVDGKRRLVQITEK